MRKYRNLSICGGKSDATFGLRAPDFLQNKEILAKGIQICHFDYISTTHS